jgi:hypothetical protein
MSLGESSVNVTGLSVFGCSWLNLESKAVQCRLLSRAFTPPAPLSPTTFDN